MTLGVRQKPFSCFRKFALECRLPLGVPAQLVMSAMDLAARLVGSPQSRGAAGQAAEREAGYVLLGALVLSLPPASVAAQRAELLELWRVALAPASAADLDIRKYLQVRGLCQEAARKLLQIGVD